MAMEISVLYIDQETNNLSSFKTSFKFDYEVLIAATAREGLDLLRQHADTTIVLFDEDTAEGDGAKFLDEMAAKFPNTLRMMMTGNHSERDADSLIHAVNRWSIHRYIRKPWNRLDIKTAIEEGYKFHLATSMVSIKNQELLKAYNTLDEFAYSVTNGLRDPILSVMSLVEIAKNMDDTTPDVREILDMVGQAMLQLDNYIENTHDNHRLKTGGMQLSDVWFNALVKSLKDLYDMDARVANVDFTVSVTQDKPVRSEESLLKIVINNLLGNAFKYQRKDEEKKFVSLDVRVEDDKTTIQVRDNGAGVPEPQQSRIFDALFRANSEQSGMGMGLYNAKEAVTKLGGEIRVNSILGEGSQFTVIIPNLNKA